MTRGPFRFIAATVGVVAGVSLLAVTLLVSSDVGAQTRPGAGGASAPVATPRTPDGKPDLNGRWGGGGGGGGGGRRRPGDRAGRPGAPVRALSGLFRRAGGGQGERQRQDHRTAAELPARQQPVLRARCRVHAARLREPAVVQAGVLGAGQTISTKTATRKTRRSPASLPASRGSARRCGSCRPRRTSS